MFDRCVCFVCMSLGMCCRWLFLISENGYQAVLGESMATEDVQRIWVFKLFASFVFEDMHDLRLKAPLG